YKLGTNPRVADTDGDGINDGDEVTRGTNPLNADSDADGISDGLELRLGTDPLNPDSDGDGIPDGVETQLGTNPKVANPTTTVQGRVVDAQGNAIFGASVITFRFFTGVTDATGQFSLPHV